MHACGASATEYDGCNSLTWERRSSASTRPPASMRVIWQTCVDAVATKHSSCSCIVAVEWGELGVRSGPGYGNVERDKQWTLWRVEREAVLSLCKPFIAAAVSIRYVCVLLWRCYVCASILLFCYELRRRGSFHAFCAIAWWVDHQHEYAFAAFNSISQIDAWHFACLFIIQFRHARLLRVTSMRSLGCFVDMFNQLVLAKWDFCVACSYSNKCWLVRVISIMVFQLAAVSWSMRYAL